jgi:hypothetical protein
MDAAGREMQVRTFVEEVWNGKNYAAVSGLYAETYANPFGTGPAARAEPIRRYHQAFPDLHDPAEDRPPGLRLGHGHTDRGRRPPRLKQKPEHGRQRHSRALRL